MAAKYVRTYLLDNVKMIIYLGAFFARATSDFLCTYELFLPLLYHFRQPLSSNPF